MSVFVLWLIIVIAFTVIKSSKMTKQNRGRDVHQRNVPVGNSQPRPQQRSFAAMPKQHGAAPNVERNCSAEDKHRYENNVSGLHKKKPSAIPNVQGSAMHYQPKKSGNRKAARQLYIGDPVPQGMRVVRCRYCAADNLVPFTARDSYKCYFCHYDI